MSTKDSPTWLVLLTGSVAAVLTGSSYILFQELTSKPNGDPQATTSCENPSSKGRRIQQFSSRWVELQRQFVSVDPCWTVGSAWLLLRQIQNHPQSTSPSNIISLLSDLVLLGFLWTIPQRPPASSVDDGEDTTLHQDEVTPKSKTSKRALGDNSGAPESIPSQSFQRSFLQQIESNLGLFPEAQKPSSEVDELQSPPRLRTREPTPFAPAPEIQSFALSSALPSGSQPRYLEMMVHNVSHTDMILGLDVPNTNSTPTDVSNGDGKHQKYALSRPRFSAFDEYSRRVLDVYNEAKGILPFISFPRYERYTAPSNTNMVEEKQGIRSTLMHRYSIDVPDGADPDQSQEEDIPIGFSFDLDKSPVGDQWATGKLHVAPKDMSDLRLRGSDASRVHSTCDLVGTRLNSVFFPLLAMLLPLWQSKLDEKYNGVSQPPANTASSTQQAVDAPSPCKKVLILVSGVGSPRNWTHSMTGNSTQACARLMEAFVKRLYPEWVVVCIHSETNIFRYDENISFVQNELMPCIERYRDAHAMGLPYPDEISKGFASGPTEYSAEPILQDVPFDPDWRKTMSITLSFADGSPARNHAIQAALRPYRPTYFHCWQLKTFWHESKIVYSDVEVHSFEEMETLPALDVHSPRLQIQRPLAWQVVQEIKAFQAEMQSILKGGDHDIRKFWLRKTHKPVLAVLAVQMTPGGPVQLFRGTNMEVSMPTGSLCAERNVIGTALASNPSLKRHHLKAIAVLSVPNPATSQGSNISRSTSTASFVTTSNRPSRSNSLDAMSALETPTRPTTNVDGGEWVLQDSEGALHEMTMTPDSTNNGQDGLVSSSGTPARRIPLFSPSVLPTKKRNDGGMPPSGSGKTLKGQSSSLSSQPQKSPLATKKTRKTVVIHSSEDLNPLRPCGACNEWLKKIAETNPYFQILTFTDANCNGVFCSPCIED